MPEDLAALVANHPLLAGLPGDMAALVTGCAHNVAVKQGEFLLVEGEAADTLYLLRRGCVTLQTHAPGRPPIVIETLEPGAALGWSWLFPPIAGSSTRVLPNQSGRSPWTRTAFAQKRRPTQSSATS